MNTVKNRLIFVVLLGIIMSCSALLSCPQDIDPFYLRILEKGQKAFISKDYSQAVRDLQVAAFGLAGDSQFRAKALVYLGLSQFYLSDLKACGMSLREAAGLLKDQDWTGLDIVEQARPDLERLWDYFSLGSAGQGASPQEADLQKKTDFPPPAGALDQNFPSKGGSETDQISRLNMDQVKEGDLVPLDLAETPPEAIRKVPAAYPAWARTSGLEPKIRVNALVSEKGQVIKTQILEGAKNAAGFNQAAEQAVRRWRFRPATIRGIKVKTWIPVSVEFKVKASD